MNFVIEWTIYMESSEQKYKKIGRNKVCFCGSGIKFKKCCLYKYHILDKDKIGD